MQSMTGYGRGEAQGGGYRLRVELRAVNHRYLDLSLRLEPGLLPFEGEIRRQISGSVSRGRLEVFVSCEADGSGPGVRLNRTLAAAYVQAAEACAEAFGIPNDLSAAVLLAQPGVLSAEPDDEVAPVRKELLRAALAEALAALAEARRLEGGALLQDMSGRLELLEALNEQIDGRREVVIREYRQRLAERITELLEGPAPDPDRLAQEVALYADRSDVTEEVVRVRSHIAQFRERSRLDGPVGKSLDFLAQELNREFNTIGSKSQDAAIRAAVIDAKAEVEKIREQIQNVE